jgi:hypothetical protein
MSDPAEQREQPTGRRGEAAWKANLERVAARNDRARKAGRARREADERQKDQARRDRERHQMAPLLGKRGKPSGLDLSNASASVRW